MTCWWAPYFVLTLNFWPIHSFLSKMLTCWQVGRFPKIEIYACLNFLLKNVDVLTDTTFCLDFQTFDPSIFYQKCWRVDGFDCFKKSKFIPVLIFVKKRWCVDGYHILPYFSNFWAIHFFNQKCWGVDLSFVKKKLTCSFRKIVWFSISIYSLNWS